MAQSGHTRDACYLSAFGAKRTWPNDDVMSSYDPSGHWAGREFFSGLKQRLHRWRGTGQPLANGAALSSQ
jgi:hypothetical protein